MAIRWDTRLSVGNDRIDLDHRYIFSLLNDIELAFLQLGEGEGGEKFLLQTLQEIFSFAGDHFAREERLLLAAKSPRFDIQKEQHQTFLYIVKEMIDRILRFSGDLDKIEKEQKIIGEHFRAFLQNHIIKEDLLMRQVVTCFPPDYLPAKRK
ncbi:MAG: hemerythrin domain-containing protein [Gammaproteobacteria bacterium]|nr:hemerythrin domain-containing protein [Gammaproteobacteria bacterium]